jgi:ribonuclease D
METDADGAAVSRTHTAGGAHARGGPSHSKAAPRAAKPARRPFGDASQGEPDGAEGALFAQLKALRARLAAEKRVPPYVIFNDATLHDMVQKRPHDWEGFAYVTGVGRNKRDRYGDVFLNAICRHDGVVYAPHNAQEDEDDGFDSDAVPAAGRAADNTGRPWSAAEDARLREEFECDATIAEMCEEHERSPFAIRARLRRLGLML